MHSLGNYVKPKPTYLNKVGSKNTTAEFYCQANAACRKSKKMVPCANGPPLRGCSPERGKGYRNP